MNNFHEAKEIFEKVSVLEKKKSEVRILTIDGFIKILNPFDYDVPKEIYALLYLLADSKFKGHVDEDDWLYFIKTLNSNNGEYILAYNFFIQNSKIQSKKKILYNDFNTSVFGLINSINLMKDKSSFKSINLLTEDTQIDFSDFITLCNNFLLIRLINEYEELKKTNDFNSVTHSQLIKIFVENLNHRVPFDLKKNLNNLKKYYTSVHNYSLLNLIFIYETLTLSDWISSDIGNCLLSYDDVMVNKFTFSTLLKKIYINCPDLKKNLDLKVDLLFTLLDVPNENNIKIKDLKSLLGHKNDCMLNTNTNTNLINNDNYHVLSKCKIEKNSFRKSIELFVVGSISGCIGSFVVYPIDLAKTRIQTNTSSSSNPNLLKLILNIYKNEGFLKLYSGLNIQLLGVAPEKAIKLTVNDFVRSMGVLNKKNEISISWEIFSGFCAGACQALVTNPLEILKIKFQMHGLKMKSDKSLKNLKICSLISSLGFKGLYSGSTICLMRDASFSALYFPIYSTLKKRLINEKNGFIKNTCFNFFCGAFAAIPSSFLTTPFDIIKTRIQVMTNNSNQSILFRNVFKVIINENGFLTLFKGSVARILRSSPQFGFTLASFEIFKKIIGNNVVEITKNTNPCKSELNPRFEINNLMIENASFKYINKSLATIKLFLDFDKDIINFNRTSYYNFINKKKLETNSNV